MRESIEEMVALTECRIKLTTVGDTYSLSNAIIALAAYITTIYNEDLKVFNKKRNEDA